MESSTQNGSFLLTKVGFVVNLLPYYSINIEEWFDLMWGISRKTREFYNTNKSLPYHSSIRLLKNLHKECKKKQLEYMQDRISKYEKFEKIISRSFSLYLNFFAKKESTLDFCRAACSLSNTKMNSLVIVGISKLNQEEFTILKNFLEQNVTKKLEFVTLQTKVSRRCKQIGCLPKCLVKIMEQATKLITLNGYKIKAEVFTRNLRLPPRWEWFTRESSDFEDFLDEFEVQEQEPRKLPTMDYHRQKFNKAGQEYLRYLKECYNRRSCDN
ncbi:unnamed protein product [Moneuplotes crassus]|uniref:Uncharacterized protein n=1 Tax=Euplotes crassus TaxID=5936 RepID=A0AAD2D1G6_EUPCR|nr:unnamed protein product [Moneuplotes crassus]